MVTKKVRVVVGDDHPLFRDGVVRALASSGEIDVVAEADDGESALQRINPTLRCSTTGCRAWTVRRSRPR